VTGGAQGLGLGSALRLLQAGYRVAILDIQGDVATRSREALDRAGEWQLHPADVADPSAVVSVSRRILASWGRVDALVNNAGIFPRHDSIDLPFEDWERVIRVNLGGTLLCCQAFGRAMLDRGGGAIVNTASGRAIQGAVRGVAYAASKAGIIALTRSLASEWAPTIRVNCVVPGIADTAQPRIDLSEEGMRQAAAQIPLRRIGQPADIGAAVAFLVSEDASYITGQCLAVNGGAIMM